MNRIGTEPAIDFGEHALDLLDVKQFYEIITHNPVGRQFGEAQRGPRHDPTQHPDPGLRALAGPATVSGDFGGLSCDP